MTVPFRWLLFAVTGLMLALACVPAAPTKVTYSANPAVYTLGVAITPNTPSLDSGKVDSYSVTPSLPPGLALNTSTGIITGTPTVGSAAASYTVTAVTGTTKLTTVLTLTVHDPTLLAFTTQPVNQTVTVGGTATFTAVATGPGTLTYQWLKNGTALTGATAASYTTPAAALADNGASFAVTVTASLGGSLTSSAATLTVNAAVTLGITTQPSNQTAIVGQTALFAVTAVGPGTLSYQWQLNGSPIAGATAASYITPAVALTDSGGAYTVVVSSSAGGSVTSATATLTVTTSATGVSTPTGPMTDRRIYHTATLLPSGAVLVTGGFNGVPLPGAELYTPATYSFAPTGSLTVARQAHTATLLANGKVLLAGGSGTGSVLASAELYDPATGTCAATGAMGTARAYHTATLLPNGRVLMVGGRDANGFFATAELYDPASGTFSATGGLTGSARDGHTATLLKNGKVLVAGGFLTASLTTAELYDPATGTFTATGAMATPRADHVDILLASGSVAMFGGSTGASVEVFDPVAGTFSAQGSLLTARADGHTATLLPSGAVLVAGGLGPSSNLLAGTERYTPGTATSATTGDLTSARKSHTATLLQDGRVLILGGFGGSGTTNTAELYQ